MSMPGSDRDGGLTEHWPPAGMMRHRPWQAGRLSAGCSSAIVPARLGVTRRHYDAGRPGPGPRAGRRPAGGPSRCLGPRAGPARLTVLQARHLEIQNRAQSRDVILCKASGFKFSELEACNRTVPGRSYRTPN
jgi:hypothetical protein